MKQLYVRSEVAASLDELKRSLPQSLLLSGPSGVGLLTIAKTLASEGSLAEVISPAKRTNTSTQLQISIERIRELYERTRSKHTSSQTIIIDDADTMSLAAQNSFLKLLEEPNDKVHFILTSHHPELLLPTVRSRLQTVVVSPLDDETTTKLLADEYPTLDATKRAQVLFIAPGRPAEIARVMGNEAYFNQVTSRMQLVRTLLGSSRYDRITALQSTSFTKADALGLIESLLLVLQRKPTETAVKQIDRLLTAYERISANGNPRLQLIDSLV